MPLIVFFCCFREIITPQFAIYFLCLLIHKNCKTLLAVPLALLLGFAFEEHWDRKKSLKPSTDLILQNPKTNPGHMLPILLSLN